MPKIIKIFYQIFLSVRKYLKVHKLDFKIWIQSVHVILFSTFTQETDNKLQILNLNENII